MISMKIEGMSNFESNLKKQIREITTQRIKERVAAIVCPEHGKAAEVEFGGEQDGKVSYDLKPCCEVLKEKLSSDLKFD